MVISHRHRFIFVKTARTAGTSIEIFLSTHCGAGDVLTPFLNFGTSAVKKNAHAGFWSLLPKGAYNSNFEYTRDSNAATAVTITQTGGNVLG
jgi:hypothetical protein